MKKGKSMKQINQSMQDRTDNAQKSKANLIPPSEKGLHEPNRPSI